ncbi:hypothetical protein [Altererythrobacter aquiaggeris]|uniref:hypothetical protein n=1 Tax=Aestuarierythrobacter aquiaggeris TaxID=1898396 RepID=UPI00301A2474
MARHLTLTRRIQRLEKQRNSRHRQLPTVMFAVEDACEADIVGIGGPNFEIDRQEGESLSDLVRRATATTGARTLWAVYVPDATEIPPQPNNLPIASQSGGIIDPLALAGIGVEDIRYRGWGAI